MEVFGVSWLVVSSSDRRPPGMTILSASLLVSLAGDVAPHDLVTLAGRPVPEEQPAPKAWEARSSDPCAALVLAQPCQGLADQLSDAIRGLGTAPLDIQCSTRSRLIPAFVAWVIPASCT
jgi:hypothetical protein